MRQNSYGGGRSYMRGGASGVVREVGHLFGTLKNFLGGILTAIAAIVAFVIWFSGSVIERLFGTEDVLPILGICFGTICFVFPVLIGGAVYFGRTWVGRAIDGTRELVNKKRGDPILPQPAPVAIATAEVPETPITDPIGMLADSLHLLVIGHTNGGKTTLVHAIAQEWARAGSTVVVCDPDASPGLWPTCDVVGSGDDWGEIVEKITYLQEEVAFRRQLRKDGHYGFEPTYIVMSEFADIARNCHNAVSFFEDLLRRGRRLDIHLVVDVQDQLVRTLQLEGKSALRTNFTYIVTCTHEDGRRWLTIIENDDPTTARKILAPRLPNIDRLRIPIHQQNEERTLAERLGTSAELVIPASGGTETPQNPPETTPSPPISPGIPTSIPASNGRGSGITISRDPHLIPAMSSLVERVNDLLEDDNPNSPIEGLTAGQVSAVIMCLLMTNDKINLTQRLVFGGKGGSRYKQVKAVQEWLKRNLFEEER